MLRGLPVLKSRESVVFGSSESEFGASVNSTNSAGASENSSSGFWMISYVPSAREFVSIFNAIFEN